MLAEALASVGLTDKQIADKMKVTESTINKWKLDHIEFSEALKRGKKDPDEQVEKSLCRRANGFKYTEVKVEGLGDQKRITKTKKLVAPDTVAAIFWLKNRRPDRWRDKQEVKTELSLSSETVELLKDDILGAVNDKRTRKKTE